MVGQPRTNLRQDRNSILDQLPKCRPFVLHVSGDFPDPINPNKTPVIRSLIDLTDETFNHHVVSINRAPQPLSTLVARIAKGRRSGSSWIESCPFDHGIVVTYPAPGRGIFHRTYLTNLGRWLVDYISTLPQRPDLLVAHKLTIEGVAVSFAARKLGLPYAVSIQGNTDAKILSFQPHLIQCFRDVFHDASAVFPFAPWALHAVEKRLGKRETNTWLLPCAVAFDDCMAPNFRGDRLISVFHLRNYKVKNLKRLTQAFMRVKATGIDIELAIIGGGSEQDFAACRDVISEVSNISLLGPRKQTELRLVMNDAIALAMPSRRESFGMVFIEALLSGTPIIYPKGASVDGYFDDMPFAIAVNSSDISEIQAAITYAILNEAKLKSVLAQWQRSGGHLRFTRPFIAETFSKGLRAALAAPR